MDGAMGVGAELQPTTLAISYYGAAITTYRINETYADLLPLLQAEVMQANGQPFAGGGRTPMSWPAETVPQLAMTKTFAAYVPMAYLPLPAGQTDGSLPPNAYGCWSGWRTGVTTPPVPTGMVSFYEGGTLLGTTDIHDWDGIATLRLNTPLPAGPHQITAVYEGDQNFAGAVAPAQTLNLTDYYRRPTYLTLTVPSCTIPADLWLPFSVTMSTGEYERYAPTGNLRIVWDSPATSNFDNVMYADVAVNGIYAGPVRTPLSAGDHTLTVLYYGDVTVSQTVVVHIGPPTLRLANPAGEVPGATDQFVRLREAGFFENLNIAAYTGMPPAYQALLGLPPIDATKPEIMALVSAGILLTRYYVGGPAALETFLYTPSHAWLASSVSNNWSVDSRPQIIMRLTALPRLFQDGALAAGPWTVPADLMDPVDFISPNGRRRSGGRAAQPYRVVVGPSNAVV